MDSDEGDGRGKDAVMLSLSLSHCHIVGHVKSSFKVKDTVVLRLLS